MNDVSRRVARQPVRKRTYSVAFGIENDSDYNSQIVPYARIKTSELEDVRVQFVDLNV